MSERSDGSTVPPKFPVKRKFILEVEDVGELEEEKNDYPVVTLQALGNCFVRCMEKTGIVLSDECPQYLEKNFILEAKRGELSGVGVFFNLTS